MKIEWPTHDNAGNPLNHAELCAWRFGGKCDCAAQKPEALPATEEEARQEFHGRIDQEWEDWGKIEGPRFFTL